MSAEREYIEGLMKNGLENNTPFLFHILLEKINEDKYYFYIKYFFSFNIKNGVGNNYDLFGLYLNFDRENRMKIGKILPNYIILLLSVLFAGYFIIEERGISVEWVIFIIVLPIISQIIMPYYYFKKFITNFLKNIPY